LATVAHRLIEPAHVQEALPLRPPLATQLSLQQPGNQFVQPAFRRDEDIFLRSALLLPKLDRAKFVNCFRFRSCIVKLGRQVILFGTRNLGTAQKTSAVDAMHLAPEFRQSSPPAEGRRSIYGRSEASEVFEALTG
jgi:hypothetical protein